MQVKLVKFVAVVFTVVPGSELNGSAENRSEVFWDFFLFVCFFV